MKARLILSTAAVFAIGSIGYFTFWPAAPDTPSDVESQISHTGPLGVDTKNQESVGGGEVLGSGAEHALEPLLEMAETLLTEFRSSVVDYEATMIKRERINGSLGAESTMLAKIRCRNPDSKPPLGLSVYLKFTKPASAKGREVIWVEGKNDGQIITHEGGFKNWKTLRLAPDGMLAMLGNKYPMTEIGLERMIEKLIEKGREDLARGPCDVTIAPDQKVGDASCTLYQITHPEKDDRFDFHIAQIFVDHERNIPLRYAAYMWPSEAGGEPPLEEEYTFLNVQLNVGLDDSDFDPENAAYDYP